MQCSDCSNLKWPVFLSCLLALGASSQSGKQASSHSSILVAASWKTFPHKIVIFW